MFKYFEYFNIFSQTPALNVSGKARPTSIFGSIIGFFAITILTSAISFIMNDYFSQLNYTFSSYTDNLAIPNIDLKDFKLGFKLVNASGGDVADIERVFKISALLWEVHSPKLGDNTTSITAKPTNIPIIKCDKYRKGSLFYDDFASYAKNLKYIDCLDFQHLGKNLTGAYGNLGDSSTINVYFKRCQNSTEKNKTDCFPTEKIDQILSHTFMATYSLDNDIKLDDKKEPFKPFLKSESTPLSTSMFKFYIREMSEIILNSDNSLVFSSNEETRGYKFTQKREEVDMRKEHANVPGTYSQMNFFANGNTIIYNRSYRKLFEVIIQIGGFSNGIIFSAYIILYLYSKNKILWECIYSIVSEKELKESINSQECDKFNILNKKRKEREEEKKENNILPTSQLHINSRINDNLRLSRQPVKEVIDVDSHVKKNRSKLSIKDEKSFKYFSFWDSICFRRCIFNPFKRRFIDLASKVIDNKLSVEYFLETSNNVELLKNLTLNEEQHEKFNNMSLLPLKEQLKEFNIECIKS